MDHERKLFISLICVLLGFGLLMVHSASITSRPTEFEQIYLSKHLKFLAIGLIAATAAGSLPRTSWMKLAPWMFWGTILLLVLVLVPGIGTRVNGAQRWFRHGSFSAQPSELVKITLPLYLCCIIQKRKASLRSWIHGIVPVAFPIAVAVPLVMLQPDLGTAVFLATAGAIALFVGGWPFRNFIMGGMLTIPAVVYLVINKPYQLRRVTGFVSTWFDWNSAPYQLKQSLVTIGTGGVWGVGLGKGFQKLSFLPEANTDFVFSVIGEELGLMGTLSVIGLWVGLYIVGLRVMNRLPSESFAYNASFTLLTQLILQVTLNVAVVTAMVPPKGIPHPLISYGGSNLVVSLMALGIILSLTRADADTADEQSPDSLSLAHGMA